MQGERIAQAFHFPAGRPCEPRGDPGLRATVRELDGQTAELTLATRRIAFGVHFDIPGFEADDEYFHLAPGGQVRVLLRGQAGHARVEGSVHAINATRAEPIRAATCEEPPDAV
jgi:beta-mannosidase